MSLVVLYGHFSTKRGISYTVYKTATKNKIQNSVPLDIVGLHVRHTLSVLSPKAGPDHLNLLQIVRGFFSSKIGAKQQTFNKIKIKVYYFSAAFFSVNNSSNRSKQDDKTFFCNIVCCLKTLRLKNTETIKTYD